MFIHADHFLQLFNDRRAEVQGEVRTVVVTGGVPALLSVSFVGFFSVVEGLHGNGVQVKGQSALRGDGTWPEGLRVGCLCAGEAQREEQGVVEDSHGGEEALQQMNAIIARVCRK